MVMEHAGEINELYKKKKQTNKQTNKQNVISTTLMEICSECFIL
jgi:hypothetical protein